MFHTDAKTKDVIITIPVFLNIKLAAKHQSVLSSELKMKSAKWNDIAMYLGFINDELEIIKAMPLLLTSAPNSWLNEMLSEWLQWAPGDARNSTKIATLEELRDALNKTGLQGTIIASKICQGILLDCLTKHSQEWRKIGEFMGFSPAEIDAIKERSGDVPKNCLNIMLNEWLRWTPGDKSGSTKSPSLEGLRHALNEAGFIETAQSIMTLEPAA